MDINKTILNNGLKVLHIEDSTTPMVAVNTLYDTGANDSTNFYEIVPRENIETALFLDSDRMLSLSFSQKSLDVQKQVVREEFKQRNLNKPYGDVNKLISELVFKVHPYQWPTIGKELSHIQDTTMDQVKEWFFSHFAPNNAVLSIVGNIDRDKAFTLAEKWYGEIPMRKIAPRNYSMEPKQTVPRHQEVERDVPNDLIVKVYHTPNRLHKDYYTSDFLSDVLAFNNTAILPLNLVKKKQKFTNIQAFIGSYTEEGLLYVKGTPAKGVTLQEADQLIKDELYALKEKEMDGHSLTKLRNGYEADNLFPMTIDDTAAQIAQYELINGADEFNRRIERHNSITAQQIKELAAKVIKEENCSTLYYHAKKEQSQG